MILEFDIGNTSLKWRLLGAGNAVVERGSLLSVDSLSDIQERVAGVTRIRVSSVAADEVVAAVQAWAGSFLGLEVELAKTAAAFAGLVNSYAEPERMGVDRWLAMLAAYIPRKRPVLVIDAGTALTLDFIDAGGQHRGGYILPGRALSQDALLRETSRVRFSEEGAVRPLPGCSTAEAVRNGALFALTAAAEAGIRQAQTFWGQDFAVVLTGGDGKALREHLSAFDEACDYIPDLVFDGLGIALP